MQVRLCASGQKLQAGDAKCEKCSFFVLFFFVSALQLSFSNLHPLHLKQIHQCLRFVFHSQVAVDREQAVAAINHAKLKQ